MPWPTRKAKDGLSALAQRGIAGLIAHHNEVRHTLLINDPNPS
jgi:hypothetical protein